jgi:hypothetical protein
LPGGEALGHGGLFAGEINLCGYLLALIAHFQAFESTNQQGGGLITFLPRVALYGDAKNTSEGENQGTRG